MSLSNSITKLLNFKENNLIFDKNFFESRTIKKARKRVKFVVMDMYSPYIDLIKK